MNNYKKFTEFSDNDKATTIALLKTVEAGMTSSNKPFTKCELSDGEQTIKANLWNTDSKVMEPLCGKPITVELKTKPYNESIGWEVYRYSNAPADVSVLDFIEKDDSDAETCLKEIISLCKGAGGTLWQITEILYRENFNALKWQSAAKAVHHAVVGGLARHTRDVVRLCFLFCKSYKDLNAEVLLNAAALHDIGKLKELETNDVGATDYTIDGHLFGHLVIGRDMVRDTIKAHPEIEIDEMKAKGILHCVAAHHGVLEYGALTTPKTKEAEMLYIADLGDSKLRQYNETEKTMENNTVSPNVFGLGHRVLKTDYTI